MGKNINPKSLKGKDKTNRIKDLMGRMNTLNESTSLSELDLIKKAPNGVIYGVVRENHKYFIKTTKKTSGKLMAEDFDYIGGLQNKFSEAYNSYAEVTKQLNLKFDMLNESFGIEDNVNILESDGVAFDGGTGFGFVVEDEEVETVDGDQDVDASVEYKDDDWLVVNLGEGETPEEELDEQEYKLKVDAPAPVADPVVDTSMEEPMEDEVDMGVEDPMDDMGVEDPMDDDNGDDNNPTKKIQKMTGKIGQMLRDMDEVDTDLEKYVINSVISALHLDQFSDEDIEDVISKLEGEDEEDDMAADDMAADDMGDEEIPMEDPMGDEEIPMEDPVVAEESFKIKKSDLVESLTKKLLKDNLNESWEESFRHPSKTNSRTRSKMARKRSSLKRRNEHHDMDMENTSTYGQYDDDEYVTNEQMRINPDMDIERELTHSTYLDCDRCEGMGCPHCNGEGYHLSGEYDGDDTDIADDFMTIDPQTGEYGPYDRDGDEIASSIDMDADGDGVLDILDEYDMDGYGVDVMDSVSSSIADDFMTIDGQTGEYGPFDRDGDEIPSSIDDDADGDGVLDDVDGVTYGDLDIEYFNQPTTKPRPGETTTKPGEKERKGPWTKPKKKGKPKAGDEGEVTSVRRSFRKKGFFK